LQDLHGFGPETIKKIYSVYTDLEALAAADAQEWKKTLSLSEEQISTLDHFLRKNFG
jgi:hypothetical protein